MLTLALQTLVFALLGVFGVHGVRVGKVLPASSRYRTGWVLTGATFILFSVNALVQSTLAASAFFSGRGTAAYDFYLSVSPAINHSRSFMIFGLYFALAALLWNPHPPRSRLILLSLVPVVAMFFGAGYGAIEGDFDRVRHYSTTAVLDTFGFIAMGSLLFASMLRDTLDRFLWFSLAASGLMSLMGVIFLSAMAWIGVPGAWGPPNWLLPAVRLLFGLGMVGLGYARYRLARKGSAVPGLLAPERSKSVMTGLA